MLIKERGSKQADIDALESLLSCPLSEEKRFLMERELRFIKSGDKGEKDSAYLIDFYYRASKKWAIIHDLRLEYENKVAQIDHLLINGILNFYVLESKNFSYCVKINTNGEFLVDFNNKYYAIESPIEQNKRHIFLLEKVIKAKEIMPTRLGLAINPSFKNYILVSPKSRVIRPEKSKFDTSMVVKADALVSEIDKSFDKMSVPSTLVAASKMVSSKTLSEVARKIAALHRPITIDYVKRFGVNERHKEKNILPEKSDELSTKKNDFYCFKCKKTITPKVASFCWDNKKRFGGRAYCFDCQRDIAKK